MNTGMATNPPRVVLDTNILISSFSFGGKPREVLFKVLGKEIAGVTSQILVAELIDVERKKFNLTRTDTKLIETQIEDNFEIVFPTKSVKVCRHDSDNRVLEAAIEGKCDFIVTGDKDLLILKRYKSVTILKPSEFLDTIAN